jgi:hypothetical protein
MMLLILTIFFVSLFCLIIYIYRINHWNLRRANGVEVVAITCVALSISAGSKKKLGGDKAFAITLMQTLALIEEKILNSGQPKY